MRLYDYAASGNCFKVRLLLGMLGVEYERVPIDIFGGDTLTCEYAMINPLRETPVLELDGGERLGAVQRDPLVPRRRARSSCRKTALERGQVAQWLSFEQERVMGGLGGPRFRLLTGRATPEELEPRLATGRGALEVLDAHLAARDWLVGDAPSIADLGLFPYVSVAPVRDPARTSPRGWTGCARCRGSWTTSSPTRRTRVPGRNPRSISVPGVEDTPTIYEWAGGREAFARWLNAFYDLVEDDEELAAMFGGAVSEEHREHVTTWWCEVMGGPADYTAHQGGYAHMLSKHRRARRSRPSSA